MPKVARLPLVSSSWPGILLNGQTLLRLTIGHVKYAPHWYDEMEQLSARMARTKHGSITKFVLFTLNGERTWTVYSSDDLSDCCLIVLIHDEMLLSQRNSQFLVELSRTDCGVWHPTDGNRFLWASSMCLSPPHIVSFSFSHFIDVNTVRFARLNRPE
ncbi:hypothetical protein DBV15_04981 [Temnothorax longispinosus]|uniref:Uncharacterized protein n=1 Tax=Temnothorax longispinosus TaxID=300112 RepID=A0A4S2KUK4_9HYME|nr:hypothetical protein DBV15_04981 [Temnothorax longispinosus]